MGEQIYNGIQEYFGFPDKEEFLTIWNDFKCDENLDYAETSTLLTEHSLNNEVICTLWGCILKNIGEFDAKITNWDTDYKTVEINCESASAIKIITFIESYGWEVSNKGELISSNLNKVDPNYFNYLMELGATYEMEKLKAIVKNGRLKLQIFDDFTGI